MALKNKHLLYFLVGAGVLNVCLVLALGLAESRNARALSDLHGRLEGIERKSTEQENSHRSWAGKIEQEITVLRDSIDACTNRSLSKRDGHLLNRDIEQVRRDLLDFIAAGQVWAVELALLKKTLSERRNLVEDDGS